MSVRVWPGWVRSNGVRSGQLGSGQVRPAHWPDWAVVGSHHHQRLVDVRVDEVQTGVVNPTAKQRTGGAIHTQSAKTHARNTEQSEETWEASQGVNEVDKWYSHPHLVQVLKRRRRYGRKHLKSEVLRIMSRLTHRWIQIRSMQTQYCPDRASSSRTLTPHCYPAPAPARLTWMKRPCLSDLKQRPCVWPEAVLVGHRCDAPPPLAGPPTS